MITPLSTQVRKRHPSVVESAVQPALVQPNPVSVRPVLDIDPRGQTHQRIV